MAAELRERIVALLRDPPCDATKAEHQPSTDGRYTFCEACGETLRTGHRLGKLDAENVASAILTLLPQPSPGEYAGLIERARGFGKPGWTHSFADCFRMIHDLADALSSALRERDMIAAVNADWSAYDKGLRERVKVLEAAISWALGEGDSDFGDRLSGDEPRYWWRAELRRRSSLSLVASEGEGNG